MKNRIIGKIENTLLNPLTKEKEIFKFVDESLKYSFWGLCIPPVYIREVKRNFSSLNIITVVDFPYGYSSIFSKVNSASRSVEDGANELDIVMNITKFLSGEYKYVEKEIKEIRKAIGENIILKVIIECGLLKEKEIVKASKLIINAGADFVKTATGVLSRKTVLKDIELIKKGIGNKGKIKAAGGIRTLKETMRFLKKGAHRIGTSKGISIAKEALEQ